MVQFSFDATAHKADDSFDPIPEGVYNVVIEDSEMRPTKAGTGEYLQLTMRVIDGQYANRKLWDRLNLVNQNQTAVKIANEALSAICHAVGETNLQDTVQLHNKPLRAVVKISERQGWDPTNEVRKYKAVPQGAASAPPAQPADAPFAQAPQAPQGNNGNGAAPVQAQTVPDASSVPPWQR